MVVDDIFLVKHLHKKSQGFFNLQSWNNAKTQISSNFTLKVALVLKVAHQKLVQNLIKDPCTSCIVCEKHVQWGRTCLSWVDADFWLVIFFCSRQQWGIASKMSNVIDSFFSAKCWNHSFRIPWFSLSFWNWCFPTAFESEFPRREISNPLVEFFNWSDTNFTVPLYTPYRHDHKSLFLCFVCAREFAFLDLNLFTCLVICPCWFGFAFWRFLFVRLLWCLLHFEPSGSWFVSRMSLCAAWMFAKCDRSVQGNTVSLSPGFAGGTWHAWEKVRRQFKDGKIADQWSSLSTDKPSLDLAGF